MSKHTPGPWTIRKYVDNHLAYFDVYGQTGHVAKIGIVDEAHERGLNRLDANARLIAAAPEMLEALKLVAEFGCECHDEPERHPCMVCVANEAIAKAEGTL